MHPLIKQDIYFTKLLQRALPHKGLTFLPLFYLLASMHFLEGKFNLNPLALKYKQALLKITGGMLPTLSSQSKERIGYPPKGYAKALFFVENRFLIALDD